MSEVTESSLVTKSFWAIIEELTIFRVIGILMLCYPVVFLVSYWFLGITGGYFAYAYSGPPVSTWKIVLLSSWLTIGVYLLALGHYHELFKERRRR